MTERIPAAVFRSRRNAKAPRVDHEGPIHEACLELARWRLPDALIHHSPNEQSMAGDKAARIRAIGRAKDLGMLTGFSDILIYYRYRLLLVEVKAPGNGLTDEQQAVGALAERNGAMFAMVTSTEWMDVVLDEFMELPPLIEMLGAVR